MIIAAVVLVITISCTNAQTQQYLQRIVKRSTVATNMTGSVNDIIAGNFGQTNDVMTGGSSGVTLVPNTGGTTFGAPRSVTGGTIQALCMGDLNGDGLDDIVYAMDDASAALRVGLHTGAGSFTMNTVIPASGSVPGMSRAIGRSVKVDDMDGDGKMDIVTTVNDGGSNGALIYLRNTGDGRAFETTYLATDVGGIGLVQVMDLDGDNRLDIVVMGVDSKKLTVYFNEGGAPANFTKVILDEMAESNLCIATGDFNNIGQGDILAIGKTSMHFYLNYYQRNFQKWNMFTFPANETGTSSDYHHYACDLYDMDGNGLIDIVYTLGLQNVSGNKINIVRWVGVSQYR
jgi:FG-GAP-like repeat